MAKEISTNYNQLEVSSDFLSGEFLIVFPKSQVFSYIYAVEVAKSADRYAEGMIGKRFYHAASFNSIEKSSRIISRIVGMLYHTKGVQIIIHGEDHDPLDVREIMSCYISSLNSLNKDVYCHVKINDSGLPTEIFHDSSPHNYLPCRLLSGKAYQRINNSIGTTVEIIDAIASEAGVKWCPSYKNERIILISPTNKDIEGEIE